MTENQYDNIFIRIALSMKRERLVMVFEELTKRIEHVFNALVGECLYLELLFMFASHNAKMLFSVSMHTANQP